MKKKHYDHRVPGKAPQLTSIQEKETFVWKKRGFGLRGVSGLKEPEAGSTSFFWKRKKGEASLKLS